MGNEKIHKLTLIIQVIVLKSTCDMRNFKADQVSLGKWAGAFFSLSAVFCFSEGYLTVYIF